MKRLIRYSYDNNDIERIIKNLELGMSIVKATDNPNLERWFRRQLLKDETLKNKVEKITKENAEKKKTQQKQIILDELRNGMTFKQIKEDFGISSSVVSIFRNEDKDFGALIDQILIEQGRKPLDPTDFEKIEKMKTKVLEFMDLGHSLTEASKLAGTNIAWVKDERLRDPDFNTSIDQRIKAKGGAGSAQRGQRNEQDAQRKRKFIEQKLMEGLNYVEINQLDPSINPQWIADEMLRDKDWKEKIDKILKDQGRLKKDKKDVSLGEERLYTVLHLLGEGYTYDQINGKTGIPVSWIYDQQKSNFYFARKIQETLQSADRKRNRYVHTPVTITDERLIALEMQRAGSEYFNIAKPSILEGIQKLESQVRSFAIKSKDYNENIAQLLEYIVLAEIYACLFPNIETLPGISTMERMVEEIKSAMLPVKFSTEIAKIKNAITALEKYISQFL